MRKIIFTADDYGCYDEIDDGIVDAVQNNLINSVAAFSNAPDAIQRLKRLKAASSSVEIGCHLTITSGKALSGISSFTNSDRSFRSFVELKRKGTFSKKQRKQVKKELQEEIAAQLDIFKQVGVQVKHLSSHHNSLTFFPEYLQVQIEIARELNIPLRSANITPYIQNRLYILQIQARSFDNLDIFDIHKMGKFTKNINSWIQLYKDSTNNNSKPFPKMPDSVDGRNYGPLPFIKVPDNQNVIVKKAQNKAKKLGKAIEKIKSNAAIEYCFHLASRPFDLNDGYGVQQRNSKYAGIDTSYFDSRRVELESLKQLKKKNFPELSSWDDL